MRRFPLLILAAAVFALPHLDRSAQAGDDDKARIAALELDVRELTAQNEHLRSAYDGAMKQLTVATQAIDRMSGSLSTARNEIIALRKDLDARPEDDPARLRATLRTRTEERDQWRGRAEALQEEVAVLKPVRRAEQRMVQKLEGDLEALHGRYRELFVTVGKPAVEPLLTLLKTYPKGWGLHIPAILGGIGADAKAAVPYLEEMAADPGCQRSGAATHARDALKKIRGE